MTVLYVIGLPGSGKTTALREATAALRWGTPDQVDDGPVPHLVYPNVDAIQLGRHRGAFSGTDALSMGINPAACEFVSQVPSSTVVLAEGDRLSNRRFFEACRARGTLKVVWFDVPPEVAYQRAGARADALGVPRQYGSWWKGRATLVRNLTTDWSDHLLRIDATGPAHEVSAALAAVLHREIIGAAT